MAVADFLLGVCGGVWLVARLQGRSQTECSGCGAWEGLFSEHGHHHIIIPSLSVAARLERKTVSGAVSTEKC